MGVRDLDMVVIEYDSAVVVKWLLGEGQWRCHMLNLVEACKGEMPVDYFAWSMSFGKKIECDGDIRSVFVDFNLNRWGTCSSQSPRWGARLVRGSEERMKCRINHLIILGYFISIMWRDQPNRPVARCHTPFGGESRHVLPSPILYTIIHSIVEGTFDTPLVLM